MSRSRPARRRGPAWKTVRFALIAGLVPALTACGSDVGSVGPGGGSGSSNDPTCNIPRDQIADGGVGRDGIPALSNPPLVSPDDPAAAYVADSTRVIGVEVGGSAVAVPHNIMWWHEVVNLDVGGRQIVVTYCPLTASALAFDREPLGGTEFGVSGLLFRSNLIMFDRATESLFSQMSRQAVCGPEGAQRLRLVPSREMRWGAWKGLHPDGRVVSEETGHRRPYESEANPYADYDRLDNPDIAFPFPEVDDRRPVKERVLGVLLGGDGGVAYPFGELERWGRTVVRITASGGPAVLFWDRSARAAVPFFTRVQGMNLSLDVVDDEFVDEETGSRWDLRGRAIAGPLAGERLEPVADAYVAYWFAWAGFQPETVVWRP